MEDWRIPPGLEYLTQIDQVLIHQKIELLEAITGFETNNQYEVKNSLGQVIYLAEEDNDFMTRNCCGNIRPFEMTITDHAGREVLHLSRPLRCQSCLFPCFLQEMEVQAPPGTTVGYIVQEWDPLYPNFLIQGTARETLLYIEGPFCACSCFGDVDFKVMDGSKQHEIGRISKQWSGLLQEGYTDADNFGVQFPMDLDVKMKAVLMGACFLIDFMFFEQVGNQRQQNTVGPYDGM